MTRKEEIKYASKDYINYLLDKQEYHNENYTEYDIQQAFEKGTQWADNNPKSPWISVEDDLPCNHDELILYGISTKVVLVSDHKGCIGLLRMKKRSNGIIGVEPWWQWEIPAVIYYWMPIPELPKE